MGSLILYPIARIKRNAVFLRESVSVVGASDSRSDRTLPKSHWGLGEGPCGQLIFMPLNMLCTGWHVRSRLKYSFKGPERSDL